MKKILFLLIATILISNVALAAEAQLFIRNSATIPASVSSGDTDVILQFDVYHSGTRTFTDIELTGDFNSPFTAVRETASVPTLDPSGTSTVTMKFDVGNADPGVYTIPISIVYTDTGTSSTVALTRNVYVQLSNEPTLELRAINTDNAFVGEEFLMSFNVENIGQIAASSVQATISLTDSSVVSWVPSTQKINFIAEEETKTITFNGIASSKAVHGAYPGTLTLTYGGKTLTNTFVLDLMGVPKLEISGINTDEEPNPGMKVSLSVQIENIGDGDAKSTKVVLNPEDSITGIFESYVGTIEAEDTGTAIFDITMNKVGVNSIPLTIKYTDEMDESHTIETTIEVYNYSAPANTSSYLISLIVVAAVLYYLYKRRQKHKEDL